MAVPLVNIYCTRNSERREKKFIQTSSSGPSTT